MFNTSISFYLPCKAKTSSAESKREELYCLLEKMDEISTLKKRELKKKLREFHNSQGKPYANMGCFKTKKDLLRFFRGVDGKNVWAREVQFLFKTKVEIDIMHSSCPTFSHEIKKENSEEITVLFVKRWTKDLSSSYVQVVAIIVWSESDGEVENMMYTNLNETAIPYKKSIERTQTGGDLDCTNKEFNVIMSGCYNQAFSVCSWRAAFEKGQHTSRNLGYKLDNAQGKKLPIKIKEQKEDLFRRTIRKFNFHLDITTFSDF